MYRTLGILLWAALPLWCYVATTSVSMHLNPETPAICMTMTAAFLHFRNIPHGRVVFEQEKEHSAGAPS